MKGLMEILKKFFGRKEVKKIRVVGIVKETPKFFIYKTDSGENILVKKQEELKERNRGSKKGT
jgi:hypothetical protein